MRKFPYKTWLWAGVFLLCPWIVHAAGLGKLTVLSALGQPLSAEIDLVSVQKDELSTLAARIASPEAFQQANIQYSPALIGVRLSIDRRADGTPYVKIISTRTVNEPFLGVLIELSWAQGRLLREYTALIDPPGYTTPAAPVAPVAAAPAVAPPAVQPVTPAVKPVVADTPAGKTAARPASSPAKVATAEYAVKRGDTLAKIAASVKPEGITLDQMLTSLYRNNADAFSGNMNRLKTGKILRVPDKERAAETSPADATKEVRVQASNWNAFRLKLADAAGGLPAQDTSKSAVSGKITTSVDDKSAGKEAPKQVLKLSKGDAPVPGKAGGGKPASEKDRMRMLEEEAIAREKSLADANERVAQLEKNIKDMQRLLEIKGVVPPGAKPAAPPAKAEQIAKAEPAKADPVKAEPAKEPAKAATVEVAKGGEPKAPPPVAEPPKADAPKSEPAKGDAPAADAPKSEAPKAVEPVPQPKPKPKPVPPPVPEPSMVDQVIDVVTDPIYLAGGLGGLAVLGGGAFWLARKRRAKDDDEGVSKKKSAPKLADVAAPAAASAASADSAATAAVGDDVDPLAEADLYLNFGRDAQAEEVLKEALTKNPKHEEAELKLLQIYAARKDKGEFEKVARNLNEQTGGVGDNWLKAAGMGYGFDPENALYAAGISAPTVAPASGAIAGTDLDFDLELAPGANPTHTDVELDSGQTTTMMRPGELAGMSAADDGQSIHDITQDSVAPRTITEASPDFTLDIPATDGVADVSAAAGKDAGDAAVPMASDIDFNFEATAVFETPPEASPAPEEFKHDSTVVISPEHQEKAAELAMDFDLGSTPEPVAEVPAGAGDTMQLDPDFKLDLGADATLSPSTPPDLKLDDISLSLDEAPKADAPAAGGPKDDHWYDVQTKFDLAKAYQEMGDKDGAREILQEVIKEGDAAQQAEAKELLSSLG